MPINYQWDNEERTILLVEFIGRWTLEERDAAINDVYQTIRDAPGTVDVIGDLTRNEFVPTNFLPQLKHNYDRRPSNVGLFVVVSKNPIIRVVMTVFMRVYPAIGNRVVLVPSVAAAREHFLQAVKHTLS